MELKSEYNTFEIESALHQLNNVLKQRNQEVTVKLHRHPEDRSYSIRFTQEAVDDSIALANQPAMKKEKFIIIEYDTIGGLVVSIQSPEYALAAIDRLRSEQYSPRIAKVVECYPTLEDLRDQEILHKMIHSAKAEELKTIRERAKELFNTLHPLRKYNV